MRFYEFAFPVAEEFNDLGKLDASELVKGQPLLPGDDGNFTKVEARVFSRVLSRIRDNDFVKLNAGLPHKGLHTLHVYATTDYQTMHCYLGRNNSSGFALTKSGELVSVFSSQRSSGAAIVQAAVEMGARSLDCFALRQNGEIVGPLFRLYSRAGFRIDTDRNEGVPGEPYATVNGISDFVDDEGQVQPDDPRVVVFMKR